MWWLRPKSVPVTIQAATDPDPHIVSHNSLWRVQSLGSGYQVVRDDQQISPGDSPELKGRNSSVQGFVTWSTFLGASRNNKKGGSDKRCELSAAPQGGTWPKWRLTGPSVLTFYEPILHLPAFTKRKSLLISNLQHSCCYLKLLPQFPNLTFDGASQTWRSSSRLLLSPFLFSSVTWSCLFVTPWTAAHQASLSITNSQSLFRLMSIE